MTIWRPSSQIKVKALGLHWRDGGLLAAEVRSDDGTLKGVRPLGGAVEFGETWQQTLVREFQEELNIDVTIAGPPLVMENIYTHEGHTGHEILFLADVTFPAGAFAGRDHVIFAEDNGALCTARWFDFEQLDSSGPALFPAGAKSRLTPRW